MQPSFVYVCNLLAVQELSAGQTHHSHQPDDAPRSDTRPVFPRGSAIDLIEEFRGPGTTQLNTGTAVRREGHELETGYRHRSF